MEYFIYIYGLKSNTPVSSSPEIRIRLFEFLICIKISNNTEQNKTKQKNYEEKFQVIWSSLEKYRKSSILANSQNTQIQPATLFYPPPSPPNLQQSVVCIVMHHINFPLPPQTEGPVNHNHLQFLQQYQRHSSILQQ